MSVTQAELARLQSITQRQNLQRITGYFSEVAGGVAPAVVWLDGLERSGVVWGSEGLIVTAAPDNQEDRPLGASWRGGMAEVEPEVLSCVYPVAALRAAETSPIQPVFRENPESEQPGSWVVHVTAAPGGEHLFVPGNLKGVVATKCGGLTVRSVETSLSLSEQSLGGGVFDLDGNLLGVVIGCDDGLAVVDTLGIEAILEEAESFEGQLVRRYGLRLRPLDRRTREHFGADTGLLVTEVRVGLPADRAGVQPGDIIQALDDDPVGSIDDLARLVLPVAFPVYNLFVMRRGRLEQLELPAAEADSQVLGTASPQGVSFGEPAEGFLIERVADGSPAARASLEAGDRLLAVNGRTPRSASEARQLLSSVGRETAFVVVRRGQYKLGTLFAQ